jgi:hypothetical protein
MACTYRIWDREAGHTGPFRGSLQYCGADAGASGLCPEHAAFVADAQCPGVSKLDQKYKYRWPSPKRPKAGRGHVVETIYEPNHFTNGYKAYKPEREWADTMGNTTPPPLISYQDWFLNDLKKKHAEKRAELVEEQAVDHAKLVEEQAAFLARRAAAEARCAMLASPNVVIGTIPAPKAPESNVVTVGGFQFEYRGTGGSGYYWHGRRIASTRQGLERMGPVLPKVCTV